MITKGVLIVVEGIQGAGKSSIIEMLVRKLINYDVVTTSWNSDEYINPIIQSMKLRKELPPYTWSLLHAADFASRYEKIIKPNLEKNKIVIADRYFYTALTRDCCRGIDKGYIKSVYSFAKDPDLILFVDTNVELARKRKVESFNKKKKDPRRGYYNSGADITGLPHTESFVVFQKILQKQYYQMFADSSNVFKIDGSKSIKNNSVEIDKFIEQINGLLKKNNSEMENK